MRQLPIRISAFERILESILPREPKCFSLNHLHELGESQVSPKHGIVGWCCQPWVCFERHSSRLPEEED